MSKISKGDILAISTPFIHALLSEERQNRCEHCFELLDEKKKNACPDCGYVYYCSEKCRDDSATSRFHQVECHIMQTRPLRNLTRLIARVLVQLPSDNDNDRNKLETTAADKNNPTEWIQGHKRDWNCLMDHYEDITHDPSAMHTFAYIYEELEMIFDGSNGTQRLSQLASDEMLIRMYGKILVNSFAVQESGPMERGGSSLRQIGRAVYLGPSIFDHSCSPDVTFTFTGTRLYLIALRDLPTADLRQVYISYIDEFETVEERRRQLKSGFYFDCGCQRCVEDTQGYSLLSILEAPKLRDLNDKIEDLYAISKLESRYAQLAQRKLHLLPSISKVSPDLELPKIAAADSSELELQTTIFEIIQNLNLESELNKLDSIQTIRIADFVAVTKANPRLLERLAAIYRQFYGDAHPRLLYKLYLFIGVLLEKISRIFYDRKKRTFSSHQAVRNLEEAQLQASLEVISKLLRQAKVIQHFIDGRLKQTEPTEYSVDQRKQNRTYASRGSSYRDLLQGNSEDLTCNLPENNAGNDTRKQ